MHYWSLCVVCLRTRRRKAFLNAAVPQAQRAPLLFHPFGLIVYRETKEVNDGRQGRQKRQRQGPETKGSKTGPRPERKEGQGSEKHLEIKGGNAKREGISSPLPQTFYTLGALFGPYGPAASTRSFTGSSRRSDSSRRRSGSRTSLTSWTRTFTTPLVILELTLTSKGTSRLLLSLRSSDISLSFRSSLKVLSRIV